MRYPAGWVTKDGTREMKMFTFEITIHHQTEIHLSLSTKKKRLFVKCFFSFFFLNIIILLSQEIIFHF